MPTKFCISFHINLTGAVLFNQCFLNPFFMNSEGKQGCVLVPTFFCIFAVKTLAKSVYIYTRFHGKLCKLAQFLLRNLRSGQC